MWLHRTLVTVTVLSLAVLLGSHAQAVEPGFLHTGDDYSDFTSLYDPLCDLDTCWFEPIHCECPDRPLNSGWFFGYSRTALRVNRPSNLGTLTYDPTPEAGVPDQDDLLLPIYQPTTVGELHGDVAWGNRFDFGWMSEEGTGLWFVVRKLDSANERVNFDHLDFNNDDALRPDGEPFGPTFATVNSVKMWGIEANKVWRLSPTPRGTILEPFMGLRYARVRDQANRTDIFNNYDQLNFPLSVPPAVLVRRTHFNYRESIITTDNDLFGGQIGMRSRWRRGRWQVASDLRGLMFWNHQVKEILANNEEQSVNNTATYDATGLTGIAQSNLLQESTQTQTFDSQDSLVYGGEWNLDLSFDITQGFALNVGGEIIFFADGIGRGADIENQESLLMTG